MNKILVYILVLLAPLIAPISVSACIEGIYDNQGRLIAGGVEQISPYEFMLIIGLAAIGGSLIMHGLSSRNTKRKASIVTLGVIFLEIALVLMVIQHNLNPHFF